MIAVTKEMMSPTELLLGPISALPSNAPVGAWITVYFYNHTDTKQVQLEWSQNQVSWSTATIPNQFSYYIQGLVENQTYYIRAKYVGTSTYTSTISSIAT